MQRYKICPNHCVMPCIVRGGEHLRFCQQVWGVYVAAVRHWGSLTAGTAAAWRCRRQHCRAPASNPLPPLATSCMFSPLALSRSAASSSLWRISRAASAPAGARHAAAAASAQPSRAACNCIAEACHSWGTGLPLRCQAPCPPSSVPCLPHPAPPPPGWLAGWLQLERHNERRRNLTSQKKKKGQEGAGAAVGGAATLGAPLASTAGPGAENRRRRQKRAASAEAEEAPGAAAQPAVLPRVLAPAGAAPAGIASGRGQAAMDLVSRLARLAAGCHLCTPAEVVRRQPVPAQRNGCCSGGLHLAC